MSAISTNREVLELIEELRGEIGKAVGVRGAVEQLEQEVREMPKTLEQRFAQRFSAVQQNHWDALGRYRGVFAGEEQARQFGLLVMAGVGGSRTAREALESEHKEFYKRAMTDVEGAALVPAEFSARLLRLVEEYGVAAAEAFHMPMTSDSLTFVRNASGVTVYLVDGGSAPTGSQPTYTSIHLNALRWGALTYYPDTLGADAAAPLGELIATEMAQGFAEQLDKCVFLGDATATYFGINGIITRLQDVDGAGTDSAGVVTFAAHDAYDEIDDGDISELEGTLPQYADANAKHYCHRKYFFSVLARLAKASGRGLIDEIAERRQLAFDGYPVRLTQVMSNSEGNGVVGHVFGDLKKAVTLGDRLQLTVKSSDQYKFGEGQVTVLGIQRIAVNVHSVGDASDPGPVVCGKMSTS